MRTVVRNHEPPLARPREFLCSVWRDVRRSRPLAIEMATRDIRSQSRQSLFGAALAAVSTLAMTVVALGFQRSGILDVGSVSMPYGLFVLVGVILWTTFVDALYAPINGLLAEQRLLARTSAPPEAIVLGKLGPVFLHTIPKIVLLAVTIAWYGVTIPASAVLAPIGLLALIALGTTVGLMLAPINLLYRDVSKLLAGFTTVWFFFSPVYYHAPANGTIRLIMKLNPVTPLLSDTRALVLTGEITEPVRSLAVTAGTAVALVLCWLYVRIALRVVIEQINE